jgi:DNA-binding NarL/FixJ family response regulator
MSRVRVVVAEDHPLMRTALIHAVNAVPDFHVVGEAESRSILFQMLFEFPADSLVLNLCLQDVCLLDHIPDLLKVRPGMKILAVSAYDDERLAFHSLLGGARGFVSKTADASEFKRALRAIWAGETYLPEQMKSRVEGWLSSKGPVRGRTRRDRIFLLTAKEMEIFRLLGEWRSTVEIAGMLHISPKTVEVHRIHIKEKLGCPALADLLRFAVNWVKEKRPPL